MSLINVVVVLLTLMILAPSQTVSATAATAQIEEPKPLDVVYIVNVATNTDFNMAVNVLQNIRFIPNSTITAISTDRDVPLLSRQMVFSNGEFSTNLLLTHFNKHAARSLDLGKMATVLNGYFDFRKDNHLLSQVCVVLTSNRNIFGDTNLVRKLRRKKTFVVALGFPKQDLSPVWVDLASNDLHVMAIEHQGAIDEFMNQFKILLSEDSKNKCDTDKYKSKEHDHCSGDCMSICFSKLLRQSYKRQCKEYCPFDRSINIRALDIYNQKARETSTPGNGFTDDVIRKDVDVLLLVIAIGCTVFAVAVILTLCILYHKCEQFRVVTRALCYLFQHNQAQGQQHQDEMAPLNIEVDRGGNYPVYVENIPVQEEIPSEQEENPNGHEENPNGQEENPNGQAEPYPEPEDDPIANQEQQHQDEIAALNIGDDAGGNPPNQDHQVLDIVEPEVHEEQVQVPVEEENHPVPAENPPVYDPTVPGGIEKMLQQDDYAFAYPMNQVRKNNPERLSDLKVDVEGTYAKDPAQALETVRNDTYQPLAGTQDSGYRSNI